MRLTDPADPDGRAAALAVPGMPQQAANALAAEASRRLMAHAFADNRDALAVVDLAGRVMEVNQALQRLCGGQSLQPGADLQHWLGSLGEVLDQVPLHGLWRGERLLQQAAGAAPVPVEVSITAVDAGDGHKPCFLVALHDLRERRQVEDRLHRLTVTDPVTGLPNRLAAQWHVEQRLAQPDMAAALLGLLFIDFGGFKELNESYGHQAGDKLLADVGARLRGALTDDALLARWAADKFTVVLPVGSGDTEVRSAAQSVLAALAQPFSVASLDINMVATLGAALAPQHGSDFITLVRKAELAVDAGKDSGQQFTVFEPALDDVVQRRVRMSSLLRIDSDRNAFHFVAQPKVDAQGHAVGAELLMRWNTEAFGAVSPIEFIPLAEKTGLIQMMGRHAAHAAAQLAAACVAAGHALPVAVNLAAGQLQQPGLDTLLLQACRRHGVSPQMIELELTESALVHNMDVVAPMLHRLRGHGFSLALDDFGTGYSSLSYLRQLPFDKVKIDGSFIRDIGSDPVAARMLASIVLLCEAKALRVVAEGVETIAQVAALQAMGVHEFQGYHFARPMLVADWLALLRRSHGLLHLPLAASSSPALPP